MNVQECVNTNNINLEGSNYADKNLDVNANKLFAGSESLKKLKLYSFDRSGLDKLGKFEKPSFISSVISASIALAIVLYLIL